MRKLKIVLSLFFCLLFFLPLSMSAAEDSLPVINLDSIYATFQLPKNFTVFFTPDTLEENRPWLASKQKDFEEVKKELEDNHVLFQAWNPEGTISLEISAIKDDWAQTYFDIEQQTPQLRSEYRADHLNDALYPEYSFESAEWQSDKKIGRFLMLKYDHRFANAITHRGFARRTIRNGYTITVDLKVFGRSLKGADNNILNKVMESWAFTQILPLPLESAAKTIYYTQPPPSETNTGNFTVKGGAEADSQVIAMVMSWTREEEPLTFETVANKKGEFKLEIELPVESTYAMSLSVITPSGATYEDLLIQSIIFNKKRIPISFFNDFEEVSKSTEMPLVTNNDKVTLEGTSIKGAKVQLMYDDKNIKKTIGGDKTFSFPISTKEEKETQITISFTSGSLPERRFHFTVIREFTQSQEMALIKDEAIKPAYKNLIDKIDGYTDRYMVYTLYPLSIEKTADSKWLMKMAMTSSKKGFSDKIYVVSEQMPTFTLETEVRLYLKCLGSYPDAEDIVPYFSLLFVD